MKISVNGEPMESDATDLAALLHSLGYDMDARIATAVNGNFVPESGRNACTLTQGDDVEIVAPRQGG